MSKGSVLVVDDNATIRAMVRKTLEGAGFSVIEAPNGAVGLEQAQADEFMLVLADINMPVMGGLDMVRSIRGESRNLKTPILVLSTENTKDVMRQGRDAGADGWMVKPFMPERLLAVVGKLTSSS